jgi:hypothetical protein
MIKNRQKRIYRVSLALTVTFTVLIFLTIGFFDSFGDSAPPILFLSFFLGIVCLVCTVIFLKRSREIDHALTDQSYIVQWDYTGEKWNAFMEKEDDFRTGQRKITFIFLTVITVIIFMMFVIFVEEEAKLAMFLVMLGLILLYAMAAFIVPWLLRKLRKSEDVTVLILPKGVLLHKQFHSWDFPMSKLASATYEKKPFQHLEIVYDFVDRTGPRSYTINIPIPDGVNEQKAHSVIEDLKRSNGLV